MSENKYKDYLRDDTDFYRQYLTNEDEPVGSSSFVKVTQGVAATVGLAAGTALAYRKGAFKGHIEELVDKLGQYRQGEVAQTLDSVRRWTKNEQWGEIKDIKGIGEKTSARITMLKEDLPQAIKEGKAAHLERVEKNDKSPLGQFNKLEINDYIGQYQGTLNSIERRIRKKSAAGVDVTNDRKFADSSQSEMNKAFEDLLVFNQDVQRNLKERMGYRQATVQEVMPHLNTKERLALQTFQKKSDKEGLGINVMDKVADRNIFVKEGPDGQLKFSDLRDFKKTVASVSDSIAHDFTIPFIQINPFRMFYLNEFTKVKTPQVFSDIGVSPIQPFVSKGLPTSDMRVFIDGRVHSFDKEQDALIRSNKVGQLVSTWNDGAGSAFARNTKNMMNLYEGKVEYTRSPGTMELGGKEVGFRRNVWEPLVGDFLGLGRQNQNIQHSMEVGNPTSYLSPVAKKLYDGFGGWKGLKTHDDRIVHAPVFGEESRDLFVPRFKTLKEVNEEGGGIKDFSKQFYAARNNPEDVTTASFFAYTFAERLNSTIGQLGLGLHSKHLGSAQQILTQLTMRRALPVLGAVEGLKFGNFVYEKAFGDELEDQLAGAFVGTQIEAGKVKDELGITAFAKEATQLLTGIEFLSELPVPVLTTEGMTPVMLRDIFQLDKTSEEIEDYYENGEERIRKGRYWEFGTTPLTGSKVDYFAPNWYRRITSDWEYTDTLWGSKEEYWMYHPVFPVLDMYHWDKKHYEDRPYLLTGGIPLLEETPLIGPVLNATIGQLLKPQLTMHQESWSNPGHYKETTGYQLAELMGVVGSDINAGYNPGSLAGFEGGSGGGSGRYQKGSQAVDGESIAYITTSGQVDIMKASGDVDIEKLNSNLRLMGAGKTGALDDVRFTEGLVGIGEDVDPESLSNPAGVHMVMSNLYSNTTEIGGFYGWIASMMTTDSSGEYDPKIATSSKAYGMNRAFWDADYGNMGGDAMEIFRRFIPRDAHKNYYNPIKNEMPTWMPGEDYFTNYQEGDPYTKLKRGEMRLPGHSYEKMYNINSDALMDMHVDGALVGQDIATITNHIIGKVTVQGREKISSELNAELKEMGVIIDKKKDVGDEENKVSGQYDMRANQQELIDWAKSKGGKVLYHQNSPNGTEESGGFYGYGEEVDKNLAKELVERSAKATVTFKQDGETHSFAEVQELNFYARHTGTEINAIVETNAEDTFAPPTVHLYEYSSSLYDDAMSKVAVARGAVEQMLDDGAIGRGDLYDPVDKYRILADAAPYSEEFKEAKAQLSRLNLSEEEKEEVQEINDQVSERREGVRTYDYRFKSANVEKKSVVVKEVLDNNTFLTEEFSDNPIRLAGVYVPTGQDEAGEAATDFIGKHIKVGQRLQISVTSDKANLVKNDTYKTIDAVVHSGNIRNLNRELIEKGLAKEEEDDYSAAAVHARFSGNQIALGAAWESFAHIDSPFHTKLLAVASPLEHYERRAVFGKDFQDWADPVNDFLVPWYQNWISKAPIAATATGALIGQFFGSTPLGKLIGGVTGALVAATGSSVRTVYESASGNTWIPERREKEREIEEYFDILKYVKYKALYEDASKEALIQENFDVKKYLGETSESGGRRSGRVGKLQQVKRDLTTGKPAAVAQARKLVGVQDNKEAYISAINAEITDIQSNREAEIITPIAAQAIQFYQESEKTMYAFDLGDPIADVLSALPRKERVYVSKFIEAPKEERGRILELVPDYVARVLQASWGMPVDAKKDLGEYFTKHELPDADWAGWDPRADLSSLKLKVVKREGLDLSEFNMWQDDEEAAATVRDDMAPQMNKRMNPHDIQSKLKDILGAAGMKDLDIQVRESEESGIRMKMNLKKDMQDEIRQQMNQNGYGII